MIKSKLSCFWNKTDFSAGYRSAVSLHSHTNNSKESLIFIPQFTHNWPVLDWALQRKCKLAKIPVDFSRAYWTPPLTPERAYDVEKSQIEDALDVAGIVSLTDHDTIDAPVSLRMTDARPVPLSLEWTVPFEGTIYHFGIHNLPAGSAREIMVRLAAHTNCPSDTPFIDLISMLHGIPDVLIVFNHPLWDLCNLGPKRHREILGKFLLQYASYIHAIELNGMRSWKENKEAMKLAESWDLPIISGGDRHGCEPSAALNLTAADTLSEFVQEIRIDQLSHVVFMPQYSEPRAVRTAHCLMDVIRFYPDAPLGSRRWDDRVFHPGLDGAAICPLSALWRTPPDFLKRIFGGLLLWENSATRRSLRRAGTARPELRLSSNTSREAAL